MSKKKHENKLRAHARLIQERELEFRNSWLVGNNTRLLAFTLDLKGVLTFSQFNLQNTNFFSILANNFSNTFTSTSMLYLSFHLVIYLFSLHITFIFLPSPFFPNFSPAQTSTILPPSIGVNLCQPPPINVNPNQPSFSIF